MSKRKRRKKKKVRSPLYKKGVTETQVLDDGREVTREKYLKLMTIHTDSVNSAPVIYDDLTILHGIKGLFYYYIYDTIQLIEHIMEIGDIELIRQEDLFYLFQSQRYAADLLFGNLTPYEAIANVIDISDPEPERIIKAFLSDTRYILSDTERVYSLNLISSVMQEVHEAGHVSNITDWSGIKLIYEAIYKLRYKQLGNNTRIHKLTLLSGKDDQLIDVVVETGDDDYTESELEADLPHVFWEIKTYDSRGNEEKVLLNTFPCFSAKTVGDLAFSQYQRGKARGAFKEVLTHEDYHWIMSSILPLLNSFERETTRLVDFISQDFISSSKTKKSSMYKKIQSLKKSKRLQNKIDVLIEIIKLNVEYSNLEEELNKNPLGLPFNKELYTEILTKLHDIRRIRNDAMHANPLEKSDIMIVEEWIPGILHIIHSLLYSQKQSTNTIDKNTGLPYWFTANESMVFQGVMRFEKNL